MSESQQRNASNSKISDFRLPALVGMITAIATETGIRTNVEPADLDRLVAVLVTKSGENVGLVEYAHLFGVIRTRDLDAWAYIWERSDDETGRCWIMTPFTSSLIFKHVRRTEQAARAAVEDLVACWGQLDERHQGRAGVLQGVLDALFGGPRPFGPGGQTALEVHYRHARAAFESVDASIALDLLRDLGEGGTGT